VKSVIKAVFDANLLISAFLSRENLSGASSELLRLARQGEIELYLSPEIIGEALGVLVASERLRNRYGYTPAMAIEFCDNLQTAVMMVVNPPATPGAVPRDPDDDKVIGCAVAASVEYIVSRDRDLLSLGRWGEIAIIAPEGLLRVVRAQAQPGRT
jgi:putative PIN family toxin of toxin-antitoxin system